MHYNDDNYGSEKIVGGLPMEGYSHRFCLQESTARQGEVDRLRFGRRQVSKPVWVRVTEIRNGMWIPRFSRRTVGQTPVLPSRGNSPWPAVGGGRDALFLLKGDRARGRNSGGEITTRLFGTILPSLRLEQPPAVWVR